MNEKAISPLTATLILVVFAIALGIITMSLGRGYEEATIEEEEPFFVKFDLNS